MGVTKNGWFIMENPIWKWMMIWGYPYDSGQQHFMIWESGDDDHQFRKLLRLVIPSDSHHQGGAPQLSIDEQIHPSK